MEKTDLKIAFLIAAGTGFQIAENLIPYPLPGLRIGFANIVTLYAINNFSTRSALTVAALRPVAAGIAGGWIATPVFLFSFLGSLASFFSMALMKRVFGKIFSNIGISIAGSVTHVLVQLAIFAVFTPIEAIIILFPILFGTAIFSGIATGYLITGLEKKELIPEDFKLAGICPNGIPGLNISGIKFHTAIKFAAIAVFITILLSISGLRAVCFILSAVLIIAAFRNFNGIKKTVIFIFPFASALLVCALTGARHSILPLLKMASVIFFCFAVSDKKNNLEIITAAFLLLKPAEKIGIPVERVYAILMVCLKSDWSVLVRNAASGLLNPATKKYFYPGLQK